MIRKVHYVLMDPTGNQTILVDTPVPVNAQPSAAAALMKQEPGAEQTGFLSRSGKSDISLRMAGGEFCGNASMSAAVYHGMRSGAARENVIVEVSGTSGPVSVYIEAGKDGLWEGIVSMPQPCSVKQIRFSDGPVLPVVNFPGISHVILEQEIPAETAEILIRRWCRQLDAEALGLMFLNREEGRLTPLVYVPAADTLFWESACGSGTSAVGAWMAEASGKKETITLRQPGGSLKITALPDGTLLLKGTVRCLYEKTAEIDIPEESLSE